MNKLTPQRRAQVINCLVEGNSIRATVRLTGVAKNTVVKLLADVGLACSIYQDKAFRGLTCKRIQCDEVWSFVGAKEKNTTDATKAKGWGDCWTWTAIDSDTKLIPCWYVGTRDAGAAFHFMSDLAARLAHRVQLTTDGHTPYLTAVEDAFGPDIDYAQLIKSTAKDRRPKRVTPQRSAWERAKPSLAAHRSTSTSARHTLSVATSRSAWAIVGSRV